MRWFTIAYAAMTAASGSVLLYVAKNRDLFAGTMLSSPVLDIRRHEACKPANTTILKTEAAPGTPTADSAVALTEVPALVVAEAPAPVAAAPQVIPAEPAPVVAPAKLVVGATTAEVLALMGHPADMLDDATRWVYDDTMIFFEDDVVVSWIQSGTKRIVAHDANDMPEFAMADLPSSMSAGNGMVLGSGFIDGPVRHKSSSSARSRSGGRNGMNKAPLSSAPRSAFFRQNRRSYQNYHQKPLWLKQWTAYRDYSRTRDPQRLGNGGARFYSNYNSYGYGNNTRSRR